MSGTEKRSVAVVGAGWAGCAAAVGLSSSGWRVSVFESRTTPGGRARRQEADNRALDNGQHILLGAYSASLRMMERVGVDPDRAFLRLPLTMCYPPASGGMSLTAAALPAPFHLLLGLMKADGLETADRLALGRFMSAARWMGWTLYADCPVSELLARFGQTARLYRLLWRPLCIAALNTLPEAASAQVFLRVLKDSIGARRAASDMLLPRCDLSALFPERALDFVRAHGGEVFAGTMVQALQQTDAGWLVDGRPFDAVVLATQAPAASRLLNRLCDTSLLDALVFEPIHTCYLGYSPETRLPGAFFALEDDAAAKRPGQFVFDRGWLDDAWAGTLAVVVSASSSLAGLDRGTLEAQVAGQLAAAFAMPGLENPLWTATLSDAQATFACTPALARPESETGLAGLVLAGDYLLPEYPGTLEAAVRSGMKAADIISATN